MPVIINQIQNHMNKANPDEMALDDVLICLYTVSNYMYVYVFYQLSFFQSAGFSHFKNRYSCLLGVLLGGCIGPCSAAMDMFR